jgi:hypothetical protein
LNGTTKLTNIIDAFFPEVGVLWREGWAQLITFNGEISCKELGVNARRRNVTEADSPKYEFPLRNSTGDWNDLNRA